MDIARDEIRAWVERALEKTGETPSALARRAGLATTTLTRFLNDQNSPMLGLRSLAKLAHVAGIEPPLGVAKPDQSRGMAEAEGTPYDPEAGSPIAAAISALLSRRNAADPWRLSTRAIEQRGYMPGDIVIVDLNAKPESGSIVCAQVYEWAKGSAETVFRVYEPPYLVAACADAELATALRRPLIVDNDRVVIKGVVTEGLRVAA